MESIYDRTASLIGEDNLNKLKSASVAVVGLGGVGGYAAEALVRSGVGTVNIFDCDSFSESNKNRQIGALSSTVGIPKCEVMQKRLCDINPDANLVPYNGFISPDCDFPFDKVGYVIDAVDNVTAKLFLAKECFERNIPLISVMGTGNKLDTRRIRVSDIYETRECPLCRVMRYECKKRGIKNLTAVWSDERPIKPKKDGETAPSSMMFVPAVAGITAAEYITKKIICAK